MGNFLWKMFYKSTEPDDEPLEDLPSNKPETDPADVVYKEIEKLRLRDRQYTDHLKEGDSSLARADLNSAEQHFAAALKVMHVRDPTAQQYQREVEPLCKLGDVYSKRGQQTGDGGDFVKAAALYNAAIARSEDQVLNGNIEVAMKEVEKSFLKCILGINSTVSHDNTGKHKKQLKEMRDQIKLEMETIYLQLDPYVHDEDDPEVREVEAIRAQAVRQLFEKIAQQRKEFISLLVEECIGLMGPPPCKYALIGLGSQATGLVTPYSDLEFAILVEEESKECLVYFQNLTHHLHLKVVNLGETILPALGIKSLNDFYSGNPLDNWYYDSVTPRGFAFDGSMPKASKTPLGRKGTKNKENSELILTPQNMVSKLQNDITLYLKEEYHLATILRNPCLIAGDQDLIDMYKDITVKILQADGGKIAQQLAQETRLETIVRFSDKKTITATLVDVKKDLYRFPAVAVDCLALSSGIIPTTVWETIEEMENQQAISPNNAHHLTVLTSISAELRLRTYMANGGQKENLSALASMEIVVQGRDLLESNTMNREFHLRNEKELFRYYYTAIPLKRIFSEEEPVPNSVSPLYDSSPSVKGMMYFKLCKYSLATDYYNKALETVDVAESEKMELFFHKGCCWSQMGDYHKAINYYEQALPMYRSIHGQTHPMIAVLLNNLGLAWDNLGDQKKAISYNEQALRMRRSMYGDKTAHFDTAISLSNLGSVWMGLGDIRKAINYFEQALEMYRGIYGQSPDARMAKSLDNLGLAWDELGDYVKAFSYHREALQMFRSIYGQTTEHPDIATALSNLGVALSDLGVDKKAISYLEHGLKMCRSIYGQTKAHPSIAMSLNLLGSAWRKQGDGPAWRKLGDYVKAISYHEQALQMCKSMYGHIKAHPDIATSLNNLGVDWYHLGDYRKAISYHEQTLQMRRSLYGGTKAHPDIARSLNNLGLAWRDLGDYGKSISYLEQALQTYRSIYGQTKAHPDIATSLNNLGIAWHSLGDNSTAIIYHEEALQMRRTIYGQTTEHTDIARSLSNLGAAWNKLGDYKKSFTYFEQALQMYRNIYCHSLTKAHPDIIASLTNLGWAWYKLGDPRKAISLCQEALAMARQVFKAEYKRHPMVKQINGTIMWIIADLAGVTEEVQKLHGVTIK
ncbi:uncharacterized protein LOC144905200 isoform X2 [Branchiostoma floridae x Branchiostoma belcheri]